MRERLPVVLALIVAIVVLHAAVRPGPQAASTPTATVRAAATPQVVRSKVEIVWPHDGAAVQDADRANITAYLLAGDGLAAGSGPARNLLDPVPCNWSPTVQLWAAMDNQPARPLGIGAKRFVSEGGRRFPAWDFNDVDVSAARDPANRIAFYVTVQDGPNRLSVLHNVWTHAADARTLFPQQDTPTSAARVIPSAVDARIQIVWPHDGLPVEQARRANVTAFLFLARTLQAVAPGISWRPVVRLHMSVNNDPEAAPGTGLIGEPRSVTAANGVKFLAWDFNDVDVSAANDPLNRLYFWVTVDGVTTYSTIWTHAADARTVFPQPDVLNSCR